MAHRDRRTGLRIGLCYDLRDDYRGAGLDDEALLEFDQPATIDGLEAALARLGHHPDRIGNLPALVGRLARGDRWDLVFNIAEGLHGIGREAQVPALLDAYGIAYTFSDPLVSALTLHKATAKRVLRDLGLPTPAFALVEDADDLRHLVDALGGGGAGAGAVREARTANGRAGAVAPSVEGGESSRHAETRSRRGSGNEAVEARSGRRGATAVQPSVAASAAIGFPLFAKPVAEGTSKGIDAGAVLRDAAELERRCRALLERYRQPVLVEEFLPGREVTVGIVGTGASAEAVGVLEVTLLEGADPEVYTARNKEACETLVRYELVHDALAEAAVGLALAAWRGLGCRDAGRVDLRADALGRLQVLEINPLAGMHPSHSDLPIMWALGGRDYDALVAAIVASAAARIATGKAAPCTS